MSEPSHPEPTHYACLGVAPSATSAEIRSTFRALAKSFHPDVNPRKDAEPQFKRIQRAYEVLSDTASRAEYDRELRAQASPPAPTGHHRAHYHWDNIARGKPDAHSGATPAPNPESTSDLDSIYDTFFGGSGPEKPGNG